VPAAEEDALFLRGGKGTKQKKVSLVSMRLIIDGIN
jgi:hypothetical protein